MRRYEAMLESVYDVLLDSAFIWRLIETGHRCL
jgi:hypothetical protein